MFSPTDAGTSSVRPTKADNWIYAGNAHFLEQKKRTIHVLQNLTFLFALDIVAEKEFDRAVEYYETCQSDLGLEFAEEVHSAIARITEYPEV